MVTFGLTTPTTFLNSGSLNFGKQQKKPTSTSKSTFPPLSQTQTTDTFHKLDRSSVKFGGGGPDDPQANTDVPNVAAANSGTGAETAAVAQANASAASVTTSDVNQLQQKLFALLQEKTLPDGEGLPLLGLGRGGQVRQAGPEHTLKVRYNSWGDQAGYERFQVKSPDEITVIPRETDDLPYVSQRQASVTGPKGTKVYIHNRVPGKQGSVAYMQVPLFDPIPPAKYPDLLKRYTEHLQEMSDMPLKAYQDWMGKVKRLDAAGACFYPSANKLIVDPKAQRLGILDITPKSEKKGNYPDAEANNLGFLLTTLIDWNFPNWEKESESQGVSLIQDTHAAQQSARNRSDLVDLRRTVLNKALQAACMEGFVKLPNPNAGDSDVSASQYSLDLLLKTGGLNDEQCTAIKSQLESIAHPNSTPEAREAVAKAIGDVFSG